MCLLSILVNSYRKKYLKAGYHNQEAPLFEYLRRTLEEPELITTYNPAEKCFVTFHNKLLTEFVVYKIGDRSITPLGSYKKLQPRLIEFTIN